MDEQTGTANHVLARRLASEGIPVFPCREAESGGKKEKSPYTRHGFKDATTGLAQVDGWWAQWPNAAPGIPTGPASGLAVIDGDKNNDTGELVGEAEIEALGLRNTLAVWVRTPGGGVHLYFKDVPGAKCSTKQLGEYVDTRGTGGYVLAPGAVMADGTRYQYEGRTLADALRAGNLPNFPLAIVQAAIDARKAQKAESSGHRFDFDSGGLRFDDGVTEATPEETCEVLRTLLAEAPNDLPREDWVKLAMSLRAGFGDVLRSDFVGFSARYSGSPCSEAAALRVWNSAGRPTTITGIGPALSLLRDAVGPDRFKAFWRTALSNRDNSRPRGARAVPGGEHLRKPPVEGEFVRDKKGKPVWCLSTALALLETHDEWRDVLAFNEFEGEVQICRPIPGTDPTRFEPHALAKEDVASTEIWFNRTGFPRATEQVVTKAINAAARQNVIDPVRFYLEGLTWDGTARLGTWLKDYMGGENCRYVHEVGLRTLIGAVARALNPGCKLDTMLILEGPQGINKSQALRALASPDWFSDGLPDMKTKDAADHLQGVWLVEMAELEMVRRADMETVKAFLSRQEDRYRPAYAPTTIKRPRRCIFIGTTNQDNYLRDETGSRRFWPVKVRRIDLASLKQDRDQLWAEAVALYRQGERWWLDADTEIIAAAEQRQRSEDDPWIALVLNYVDGRTEISIREVLQDALHFASKDASRGHSNRVAGILKAHGWVRDGLISGGPFRAQARYRPE